VVIVVVVIEVVVVVVVVVVAVAVTVAALAQLTQFNPSLTLRRLMSYIYGAPILDVSRSHTTTQHSR